jgi:poly(A) polymerase
MTLSFLHSLFDDPITQKIFEVLKSHNIEARFVGGCVRDALLNKISHDIDLAVDAAPPFIIQAFKNTKINVIPTGIDFGTVTAILDGKSYQITSLRQDWQGKGRHPMVIFGKDWLEDAKRRDFTINAIYADSSGTLFDPFNGTQDLKKQYVRFVGNPEDRLKEDPLRILRYFRFLAMFDKAQIDLNVEREDTRRFF